MYKHVSHADSRDEYHEQIGSKHYASHQYISPKYPHSHLASSGMLWYLSIVQTAILPSVMSQLFCFLSQMFRGRRFEPRVSRDFFFVLASEGRTRTDRGERQLTGSGTNARRECGNAHYLLYSTFESGKDTALIEATLSAALDEPVCANCGSFRWVPLVLGQKRQQIFITS